MKKYHFDTHVTSRQQTPSPLPNVILTLSVAVWVWIPSKKQKRMLPEADSGPHHTSKMEVSVKGFNELKLSNIFTNSSILDAWRELEFACDFNEWRKTLGLFQKLARNTQLVFTSSNSGIATSVSFEIHSKSLLLTSNRLYTFAPMFPVLSWNK